MSCMEGSRASSALVALMESSFPSLAVCVFLPRVLADTPKESTSFRPDSERAANDCLINLVVVDVLVCSLGERFTILVFRA